jgi:hypothetical protein
MALNDFSVRSENFLPTKNLPRRMEKRSGQLSEPTYCHG